MSPVPVDLLLINAGNYPRNQIYPYAFVQVRALAHHHGLQFASCDLLGTPVERYDTVVARLLRRYRPRLIGVTLRQADSITAEEYACRGWKPYFPVETTDALIKTVRAQSSVPIVMGGFGFTTHAAQLFDRLRPDFGVEGEPDDLLARFTAVIEEGRCAGVGNLLYRENGAPQRNPRVYHGPFNDREYDEEVVAELEAFYGRSWLYSDRPPSVAIELSRGCMFRCAFCTEPFVKGRRPRHRDLAAVLADVEFLAGQGLRRFFLVCSELNQGDNTLALAVAEGFVRLNEHLGAPGIRWHAYHLPRWLGREDLKTLYRSGFAGGWNDFPSFDDDNLLRLRVPYRTHHVLEHLRNTMAMQGDLPFGEPPHVNMFLGNDQVTPATIARSLQAFSRTDILQHVEHASIAFGTRLFAPHDRPVVQPQNAVTYTSVGPSTQLDIVHPTFYLAPGLEATLGRSPEEHRQFFDYVASTFLSRRHVNGKDWARFLATAAPTAWVGEQLAAHRGRRIPLAGVPAVIRPRVREIVSAIVSAEAGVALDAFLSQPVRDEPLHRAVAAVLVALISQPVPLHFLRILDYLGLPHERDGTLSASAYDVEITLLARYESIAQLLRHIEEEFAVTAPCKEIWLLRRLLYDQNVILRPDYRPLLLVSEPSTPSLQPSGMRSVTGGVAHP